ncbi:MAG: hypothetical protein AAGI45_09735 [Cyanobacteria bacterium P01_H01_bin.26]
MSKPIYELVNELPQKNLTVFVLRSLDRVLPGEWENLVGFENTIRQVTGESDAALVEQIGARAIQLYNDKSEGYQRALWLYQTIDTTGRALGQAALANKMTENVRFLSIVNRLTPKADRAQSIDLSMKLVTEIVAFCKINGIPGDSVGDFVKALGDYGGESLVRMVALVCFDGLVPLGPNFIQQTEAVLGKLTPKDLEKNPAFRAIKEAVPGGKTADQLNFIGASFDSVKGWMGNFVESKGITPQGVVDNIKTVVDVADDKLDYFGAFLDIATNYYEHTGIQTLSRRLIERAVAEI